ncbi:uncharacterized protein Z518_04561 [Rhinocladiella mackenziei CBS 650.93]|uniref:Uncharacterized protein n=1 Tax=Rhinocladiella mackenziei CBS 650.93 TaxID=1442369 RepID=A0A0D2JBW1_9EURO|nr:uncharacterized protein Z518_04561 [Rhinocladiella mackenziei CBS 650.93]KIX06585.1 hypothetical protein Z518_04561 [Rhinocladiella mackenziei CBS 650.93]
MSLKRLPQLPARPSMQVSTERSQSKLSASDSGSASATPSPTFSTQDSRSSTNLSTSVSDPDDYADAWALQTMSSATATMRSKSIARDSHPPSENGNRRASGRVRKPTAKAQALNDSKSHSHPVSDTIVVSSSPVSEDRSAHKERPSTPPSKKSTAKALPGLEIPESPAAVRVNGATTPPKLEADQDEMLIPAVESPSRRLSQRERKPTAKALSTSITPQKRPAVDSQEIPSRKSARISFLGPKVPSKLRYSISSAHTDNDDLGDAEIAGTPPKKKSKVIILKSKRLSDVFGLAPQPAQGVSTSSATEGKSLSQPEPSHTTSGSAAEVPQASDTQEPCNLSCLSPSSRLLAFAEIARQMPDSDDEDEVVPGSLQDWRIYTQAWCQCEKNEPLQTDRTNSVELARALLPNKVSEGTLYDPVDLTRSVSEVELLSTPVNTIIRATDAERLSQLFTNPGHGRAARGSNPSPVTTGHRRPSDVLVSEPVGPTRRRSTIRIDPHPQILQPPQPSSPMKKAYEEPLRDDRNALSDIRKRAAARGIQWNFNMTFDDIHALLMDLDERQQEMYQHQPILSPHPEMRGPTYDVHETHGSPSGFGMLLPPRAIPNGPQSGNGRQRRQDTWVSYSLMNGPSDFNHGHGIVNNTSCVEDGDMAMTPPRRFSSPGRPKSSRFRVDPRGLRGESPGPGTIINIDEKKNGTGKQGRRSRD